MPDPLFTPEARYMLLKDDKPAMEAFADTLHPATVAESLTDAFSIEETWRFLHAAPVEKQAAIFPYFSIEMQLEMVKGAGREQMAHLIEEMSHDDRASLLRELPVPVRDNLLRLVDEADRRDIVKLIQYPEDTAGALMTTDYAWLPHNITTEDALERLRLQAPDSETIYYAYIVDDQRRLLGVVSLRDIIMHSRPTPIAEFMETKVVSVKDTQDRQTVAQLFGEYNLIAVPVVDVDGRLVGIITSDDVLEDVVEQATEDAHRMGAVGPMEESYLEAGFFKLWRNRAFWLSCLFGAELFTFTALSAFEESIAQVVVLSLFVPLCISTGGNSGSQAATLITRALALGEVSGRDWLRVFRHEIVMGILLGLSLGLIGFFRASLTPESVRSSSPPRMESFEVRVPASEPLEIVKSDERDFLGMGPLHSHIRVNLPPNVLQSLSRAKESQIKLPEDEELPEPTLDAGGNLLYSFPAKCSLRVEPVPRWDLALVIAISVAAICLWGTVIGSMLPLIFKRLGVDPGIASSPFVATFVDVTGIVIYFSVARMILAKFLA
jgi:magnesium transporter